MHSAFNQFAAFQQDAIDNKNFAANGNREVEISLEIKHGDIGVPRG
jgi:hypothetical protein